MINHRFSVARVGIRHLIAIPRGICLRTLAQLRTPNSALHQSKRRSQPSDPRQKTNSHHTTERIKI